MKSEFTVCFLFDETLENVLLVKKKKTDYIGRLNGCGGEVEADEVAYAGALREIEEETGISRNDLKSFGPRGCLVWLGTLNLPYNCKYPELQGGDGNPPCVLHYYAGVIPSGVTLAPPQGGEELGMYPVQDILSAPITCEVYAGDGDLQYFVGAAFSALSEQRKDG